MLWFHSHGATQKTPLCSPRHSNLSHSFFIGYISFSELNPWQSSWAAQYSQCPGAAQRKDFYCLRSSLCASRADLVGCMEITMAKPGSFIRGKQLLLSQDTFQPKYAQPLGNNSVFKSSAELICYLDQWNYWTRYSSLLVYNSTDSINTLFLCARVCFVRTLLQFKACFTSSSKFSVSCNTYLPGISCYISNKYL